MKIFEFINRPSGNYGLGGTPLEPQDLLLIKPEIEPIAFMYNSSAEMFADQSNQKQDFIYYNGSSYYHYLGSLNSNINDYRSLGVNLSEGPGLTINNSVVSLGDDYISYSPNNELNVVFNDPNSTLYAASYLGMYANSAYSGHEIYNTADKGGSVMEQYENASAGGYSYSYQKFGGGRFKIDYLYDYIAGTFKATIRDTINNRGLEYDGDYEANFTNRSLVTKQYVDLTSSNVTASLGLEKSGDDIRLGEAGSLLGANNAVTRHIDYGSWGTSSSSILEILNSNNVNAPSTSAYYYTDGTYLTNVWRFRVGRSTGSAQPGSEAGDNQLTGLTLFNETGLPSGYYSAEASLFINGRGIYIMSASDPATIGTIQRHMRVVDSLYSQGLVNGGDYEANFVPRSLVTKQYVDGLVSGAGAFTAAGRGLSSSGNTIDLGDLISGTDYQINLANYVATNAASLHLKYDSATYKGTFGTRLYNNGIVQTVKSEYQSKSCTIYTESGPWGSYSSIGMTDGTSFLGLNLTDDGVNKAIFYDGYDLRGIIYGGDYEENFVDRSLVTKKYVDDNIQSEITSGISGVVFSRYRDEYVYSSTSTFTLAGSPLLDNLQVFINGQLQPKTGAYTLLGDQLTITNSLVNPDRLIFVYSIGDPAFVLREQVLVRQTNVISFDYNANYGIYGSPINTTLTFDFNNATLGTTAIVRHQSAVDIVASFPSNVILTAGFYDKVKINYLYFNIVKTTAGDELVLCSIAQKIDLNNPS